MFDKDCDLKVQQEACGIPQKISLLMESGEELKLNPTEVKDHYLKQVKKFREELKIRCGHYHIDFIKADINQGVNQVLMQYC